MKNIPIYDKTADYAREHGELEPRRASHRENIACSKAITDAIHGNYANNSLDTKTALKQLTDAFSLERIAVVTAVSIRDKDWDARISNSNKEWAKAVPFPKDIDDWGVDRNADCKVTETHPGLLNLFTDAVRKELEITKTVPLKKPSLVEKLSRPLPQKADKSNKTKEQELC